MLGREESQPTRSVYLLHSHIPAIFNRDSLKLEECFVSGPKGHDHGVYSGDW